LLVPGGATISPGPGRRWDAAGSPGYRRRIPGPPPSKRRATAEPPKSRPRAAVANYAPRMAKTCKNEWSINTMFKNTMFR